MTHRLGKHSTESRPDVPFSLSLGALSGMSAATGPGNPTHR